MFAPVAYPTDLDTVVTHRKNLRTALLAAGVPRKLLDGIETRALRSGRRQTGQFQSNRGSRWQLHPDDPQYSSVLDANIIYIKLMAMLLEFKNAPSVSPDVLLLLEKSYLGRKIVAGTYKDTLLLEEMDYQDFVRETENPVKGRSNFHIGHEDPTAKPKHHPDNISWRTHRSNLIQGDMTLRQARIYIIKLIGRYFELGELSIT